MSDRAAGVFYIIYNELIEMDDPEGHYAKICIFHYSDYGETLVGTYCHDLMMNYPESCTGVLDMEAEVWNRNNVALSWNPPQTDQPVAAYYVYRNDMLIAVLQQTTFLDENVPNGSYTYHVRVVYADGCESLSYNTVKVAIETEGIRNIDLSNIRVYPNPTTGELRIENGELRIENIEIFDLIGNLSPISSPVWKEMSKGRFEVNISHLPPGIYFIRIQTETGVKVKKVIKQ
jgi:hypothetical protein